MRSTNVGQIREERCKSHKHVEWDVDYSTLPQGEYTFTSPVFTIKDQRCILELRSSLGRVDAGWEDFLKVSLFRAGQSVVRRLQWFAGIKRRDGSYHHRIQSGFLSLYKNCSYVKLLGKFRKSELKRWHRSANQTMTFFLRLNRYPQWPRCSHDTSHITPSSEGRIREENCSCHKHVEWDVDYTLVPGNDDIFTSPVFVIDAQRYILEFRGNSDFVELRLFRSGPSSAKERVRCFAGVRREDGSYHHRIDVSYLNLSERCEMWREVNLFSWCGLTSLILRNLTQHGRFTFFCRMNVERATDEEEGCTHGVTDMHHRTTGSISEEPWDSYKQVEWNVDYEPSMGLVTSPLFRVDGQAYLLELSSSMGELLVAPFRTGPSVNRSVRWWAVVNRADGTNHHYGNKYGKMNLEDESYVTWRPVEMSFGFPYSGGRTPLVVGFLISLERKTTASKVSTKVDVQSQDSRKEEVSFRVQGKEMKVHRAILSFRSPVMNAMFSHNTVESITGVVRIKDCDAQTFRTFLNFIERGNSVGVNSSNARALYAVAQKYMVDDVMARCVRCIKDSLSLETLFSIAEFAVMNGEDELLRDASHFLALRTDFIKTKAWQKFSTNNVDVANSLLSKHSHMDSESDSSM